MPQDLMTLDEIGQAAEAQNAPKPKLAEIKLDGDEVPEMFKGKSVADVVAQHEALRQALKISEDARQQALGTVAALSRPGSSPATAAVPPVAPEEKDLTPEQIRELHEKDPIQAMIAVNEQNNRRLLKAFEQRVAPLVTSTVGAGEVGARAKYKEEFEVLGKEIKEFIDTLPNPQQALAQPNAWDQLVTYVRGQHIDKIVAHRIESQKGKKTLEDARQQEDEDAGASVGKGQGRGERKQAANPLVWDSTMAEIAKNLGVSKEEYLQFYVEG